MDIIYHQLHATFKLFNKCFSRLLAYHTMSIPEEAESQEIRSQKVISSNNNELWVKMRMLHPTFSTC